MKLYEKSFGKNSIVKEKEYDTLLSIDVKKFNPSFSDNTRDLLVLSFNIFKYNENLETSMAFTLFKLENLSRKILEELFNYVKKHKILYIPYSDELDIKILNVIIKFATLLNTVVIIDEEYRQSTNYKFCCSTESLNIYVNYLLENYINVMEILNDYQRKIFIKDSNIMKDLNFTRNGVEIEEKNYPRISVIISTIRKTSILRFLDGINQQKFVELEIVLLTHGFKLSEADKKYYITKCKFELIILEASEKLYLGECLNMCIDRTSYEMITKMDDDDIYGDSYLVDNYIAFKYTNADIIGKGAHFVYLEGLDLLILREKQKYNQHGDIIMGATIFTHRGVFEKLSFRKMNKSEDSNFLSRAIKLDFSIYQTSPFEYCVYRNSDVIHHTWKIDTNELVKGADIISLGRDLKLFSEIYRD